MCCKKVNDPFGVLDLGVGNSLAHIPIPIKNPRRISIQDKFVKGNTNDRISTKDCQSTPQRRAITKKVTILSIGSNLPIVVVRIGMAFLEAVSEHLKGAQ